MTKEEIQNKIASLKSKLSNPKLSEYYDDFNKGIAKLENDLAMVGETAVKDVKKVEKKVAKAVTSVRKPRTTKASASNDIEKAKAEIKAKTGKTESECEDIIEKYRALRTKSQERRKKEVSANESNTKRIVKLKKQGDIIEGTNIKTADATIESAKVDVVDKIEKQIEIVEEKAEVEAKKEVAKDKTLTPTEKKKAVAEKVEKVVKEKTKVIVKRVIIDTTAFLTSISEKLGEFDKDSQKEFLIKLRSDIDKLLSKYSYGGMTSGATQGYNITQSNMSSSSVNSFANGGGVFDWKKQVTSIIGTKAEAEKSKKSLQDYWGKSGRNFQIEKIGDDEGDSYRITYEFTLTDKMANGGGVDGKEKIVKVSEGYYEDENGNAIAFNEEEDGSGYYFLDTTNGFSGGVSKSKATTKDALMRYISKNYKVVNQFANGGGIAYNDALFEFNSELMEHPIVIELAKNYNKTPQEIVKNLQPRISTKGNRSGKTTEVSINFTDSNTNKSITYSKKFDMGGGVDSNGKPIPQYILEFWKNFADGDENTKIRSWYMKAFPQDNRGKYLDLYNTFEDLWNAIHNNQNVYHIMGERDSLIRERLFDKLSQIKGVKYDYIYDKWLESDDDTFADGGGVGVNGYANKSVEQIWNEWTPKQKRHFLSDHKDEFVKQNSLVPYSINELSYKTFDTLKVNYPIVYKSLQKHIQEGEYAKGGGVEISKAESIKNEMYKAFESYLSNKNTDAQLVSKLQRILGSRRWFRYFKGDTGASDFGSVKRALSQSVNRDGEKESMQISIDTKGLQIYDYYGDEMFNKGGSVDLASVKEQYEENEDINNHSENVVLLAKYFGSAEDLKQAERILSIHDEEGHLSGENSANRRKLSQKLIDKARKEMAKKGIQFAKGGMTEHGLKVGDTITDDMFWEDKIVVKNKEGKKHLIDLDKGKRYANGGGVDKMMRSRRGM